MLEADYHGLYNTSLGREITVSSETGVQLCGKFIDYFAVENGFGGATLILFNNYNEWNSPEDSSNSTLLTTFTFAKRRGYHPGSLVARCIYRLY